MYDTEGVAHNAIIWSLVRVLSHSPLGLAVLVVLLVLIVVSRSRRPPGGFGARFGRRRRR